MHLSGIFKNSCVEMDKMNPNLASESVGNSNDPNEKNVIFSTIKFEQELCNSENLSNAVSSEVDSLSGTSGKYLT